MTNQSKNDHRSMFPVGLKVIAYVLSFLMVLYAIPTNVYAEIIDAVDSTLDGTSDNVDELSSAESEMPADKAVFEVIDRREESVKHFRDADGSYVAAQYDYPVHELDANGEWQDIDNTLAESGSEYATPNARVKFAKKITGSETLFTLHDGNRKITMSLSGANKKVAGQVTNTHTEFDAEATELQKLMALDKLSSRILYPEILNDVDLEYVVQPDSIKENIIVKEKGDEYRYSFDIRLNNLTATLQEDGSVCIADPNTNEIVYVIPAGYMFDGTGEYSDAVQYELIDNGSGKYTLTVTADAEWINADERVFPVTIDPTIEYNKEYYGSVVESTYILDSASSTNYSTGSYTYAGYSPSTGNYSTYVKMKTLPSIPNNATITNAFLEMNVYSVSNSPVYVGIYRVSGTWNYSTLTYSNRPSAVSSYTDYQRITGTGYYKWDITEFMRGWYDGSVSNYGVMLKSVNSTTTLNQVTFRTERNTSWAPSFIISYQDTKGIEDYYSYYSSSADLAGSGYVNALTGALTFVHSSMSTTDEILPYEVSFTYNSALKGKYYTSANTLTTMSSGAFGYGFKMSYDETIKQVTLDTGDDMFIWADSDGTEHYFTIDNYGSTTQGAGYCDEDGLGIYLYLEEDNDWGTGYQIRDDAGNIKRFTSKGYLDYIQDINGNKRKFVREGSGRVTSITLTPNGASGFTQLQMTYGSSGMLGTVTNSQTGLKATMYYSSTYNGTASTTALGYLRKIIYTYASGYTRTVTFEYNSSGDLIMAKDLKTGSAIHYAYSSGKVTTVSQYVKATETSTTGGMTLGKKASISYGTLSSQYTSAKETSSTSDDVTTYYQFDPAGRVVSAYTQDANNLYGASNRTYDDSSVKKQNAVSSVLQIGTDTINYLLNPGFELYGEDLFPTHWTVNSDSYCLSKTSSSNSSSTYLYLTATKTTGTVRATQKFKLPAGTYTASASFDRSELGQNGKARLVILNSSGTTVAYSDYLLPFEANRPTADVQETKSVTFTVTGTDCSTNGWTLAIELSFINTPQSNEEECILVDNVMLEKSAGASRYSLLGNGGFENNSSSTSITEWTLSNAQRTVTRRDGQYAISITGSPANQAYAHNKVICKQGSVVSTFTTTPDSYIISGWAKANSAYTDETLFGYTGKPVFALKAVVHYVGTTSTTTEYIPFDDHYTGWQFATGIVSSTLLSGSSYRQISYIDVYCCYNYNIGTAYFDSISVVKDTNCVTNYEYNNYGYVSNVTNSDGNGVDYTYASNGVDITGATSTDGTSVNMTYDANHRLLTETNQSGPNNHRISYTYDAYGNVTSTTISDLGGSAYIRSSTTYSTSQTNFGATLTSTDPNARISRMFYDSKARLIGTCANDNTGLIYTYDSFGRVTKVEEATYNASTGAMQVVSGGSSVSSTYNDNDRGVLSAITTATASYSFVYDDFGNMKQITVNGYTLSTNTYAANNGNLTKTEYGNDDSVNYTYDNVDRITKIQYNDDTGATAVFTYTYNANGDLSSHTDSINGETHVYTYDAKGNIAQRIVKNTTGDTVKRIEQYTYDQQGRVASVDYSYVSTTDVPTLVHYGYEYDITGNLTNAEYVGTSTQTAYTYDAFGRLETEVFQNVSGSKRYFDRMYLYSTNSSATSNQIEWDFMSSYDGKSYDSYYEYDDVGNIVLIEVTDQNDNIILQYNYHYDDKSQLTREDLYYGAGNSLNRTMVYTYDKAGNILSKKKYVYINPANSVSGSYTNYSYGYASTWKDRLTSYNGKSLTYDEIGNPLTYGTYSYEWAYGRQLSKVKNGSTEVATYQYNDEGIRTAKIVTEGTTQILHEYDVVGGQINREVIHSSSSATSAVMKDIRYYYDASGKPIAIRAFTRTSSTANFTDTIYYLQTNLQGDVIAIYNESGTKIYEYAYDAWGNIIESASAPGYTASGNAAHAVNPFRYRGYYYDTETGFYYLQSRYYNPEWGRFLNADFAEVIGNESTLTDKNLYAYCDSNPVMRQDHNGEFWHVLIGAGVGIIGQYVADVVSNVVSGEQQGWNVLLPSSSLVDYFAAAASGALAATGIGTIGSALANAAIDGTAYVANKLIEGEEINGVEAAVSMVFSAVTSGKGINGKNLRGIVKRSNQVLETAVSPRKIAMYTAKKTAVKKLVKKEIITSLVSSGVSGLDDGLNRRFGLNPWG